MLWLAVVPPSSAEGIAPSLQVEAPSALADLLRKHLDLPRMAETGMDEGDRLRLVRQTQQQSRSLLETEGHFTPKIGVEVLEGGKRVAITIDPGPRTEVEAVEIEFRGDVAGPGEVQGRRREALRQNWALKAGSPFRQEDWSQAKQAALLRLQERDYAAATIDDSAAEIDPERARAKLRVVYDSGPAFTLGKLEVTGLESYSPDLVERYSTLREGEPYDHERLLGLQNALQNTRYFAAVAVDVAPDPTQAQAVPVRVTVREARPKRVGFGVGFSSNTGPRVEATYSDANFLDRAWNLATGLRIEQKRQFGYADVYLPPSPKDYRDSFGVLAERSDIQGLMTQRSAAAVVRARTRGRIETRLTLALQHENLRPEAAEARSNTALTLNYAWTYRAVDNLLDPRAGYVIGLQAGGGLKALLSDEDFLRLHGRYQHYFPIGERDVLILRGELGHTSARTRVGIPQDFLFRTGGAQTVRGYAYESLGLKDGDAVVGGRKLAVASAEYVHWLNPQWGMAAFYDAGNAWDTTDKAKLVSGYGLGARWRSPAGPLAVDLAYGDRDRKVRLHFAVAVAF